MKNKKQELYESVLQDVDEKRVVDDEGRKITIEYQHRPNIVGDRNKYTGLPIWVGKTIATAKGKEVEAKCWTLEPFDFSQARVVATGRLLKKLNLPTSLAEQVKE